MEGTKSLSALGLSHELPFHSSCAPGVATPELIGKWSCLHAATLRSANTEELLPFSFGKTIQAILLLFQASFKGPSLQKQLFVSQLSPCTMPSSLRNRDLINSFWHKLPLNKVMHACWDEVQDNWAFNIKKYCCEQSNMGFIA